MSRTGRTACRGSNYVDTLIYKELVIFKKPKEGVDL
jgi:hypothetical protein